MLKYITMVLILVISLLTFGNAQETNDVPDSHSIAEFLTGLMDKELYLTSEQKAKASEINLYYARSLMELRPIKDQKKKFQKFRISTLRVEEEFKEILTDEQFKEYKVLRNGLTKTFREMLRENNKKE